MAKTKKSPPAGIILFIGATQLLLCLIIAVALYPNYSIANNYISDLGMVGSPSAWLFNISIFLFGLSIVYAAIQLLRSHLQFAILLFATGVGFTGVGIFTGDYPLAHLIFALTGLIAGAITMIASIALKRTWFGYFSVVLGVFSLIGTILLLTDLTMGIGIGGMERLAFYAILIWLAGFSGGAALARD